MQANSAEGRKNDRLKEKERNLTGRMVTAIYIKEGRAPA